MSCWDLQFKTVIDFVDELKNVLGIDPSRIYFPVGWKNESTLTLYVDLRDVAEEYGEELVKHIAKAIEIIAKKKITRVKVTHNNEYIDIDIPIC